jgi:hypothetical protein
MDQFKRARFSISCNIYELSHSALREEQIEIVTDFNAKGVSTAMSEYQFIAFRAIDRPLMRRLGAGLDILVLGKDGGQRWSETCVMAELGQLSCL